MPNKPTKALIEAQAAYISGSLTQLPYTVTQRQSGSTAVSLASDSSGWWGPFYRFVAREIAYHRLEFANEVLGDPTAPSFPPDWRILLPPTVPNKAQQAVDQIFVGDPLLTAEVPGKSNDARTLEKTIAKYLMGRLQDEERTSDISPLEEQKQLTLYYGLAARMTVLDPKRWPDKPERKRKEDGSWNMGPKAYKEAKDKWDADVRGKSPFVTRTLPPLSIAYDRVNSPPQWVMIREPIMPWDAQALYPDLKLPEDPVAGATAFVWTKYWTPEWYACYVNGIKVLEEGDEDGVAPNPYGFIPVWPSGGAHGELDVAGRPEVELAGILRNLLDSFLTDAILYNILMIYARRAGFGPKVWVKGDKGEDDPILSRIERMIMQGPERVIKLGMGYEVGSIDPTTIPQAVAEMRAAILADIDRGIIYDVAAGDPNPAQSGVSRQIIQQQISKKVSTTVLHLQQSVEAWAMGELRMIKDVLQENVSSVYGSETVELKWKDLHDGITVKCDLLTDSAVEKARKVQEGLSLLAAKPEPLISMDTFYRDYMQLDDPESERKAKLKDAIWNQVIVPMLLQVAQGQGPALIAGAAQAAGINTNPAGGGEGGEGEQMAVGATGVALQGEGHNPANDAGMTAEKMDLEQRQMMGQTEGTRAIPRIKIGV